MSSPKILIVSGTHGNEINPIWAVNKFLSIREANNQFVNSKFITGNPKAFENGQRYVDFDLNRAFDMQKINSNSNLYEFNRANYLIKKHGQHGTDPCQLVIDLHTTTAKMGTSIVMYGRREKDFCLAAILQSKFGLPIYLHEKDPTQTGFLVESWPCGLVIEIGSVAQNFYDPSIIERFIIMIDFIDSLFDKNFNLEKTLPPRITVFVHLKSIDYPRNEKQEIDALIHPLRFGKDWQPIRYGDPLFLKKDGGIVTYKDEILVWPVFIGESAYIEKKIAMSFTNRQVIDFSHEWLRSFLDFG